MCVCLCLCVCVCVWISVCFLESWKGWTFRLSSFLRAADGVRRCDLEEGWGRGQICLLYLYLCVEFGDHGCEQICHTTGSTVCWGGGSSCNVFVTVLIIIVVIHHCLYHYFHHHSMKRINTVKAWNMTWICKARLKKCIWAPFSSSGCFSHGMEGGWIKL